MWYIVLKYGEAMTSIFIFTIGVIPNDFVGYIKQTIERFYRDVKSSLDVV